jgi:hypothetical protein
VGDPFGLAQGRTLEVAFQLTLGCPPGLSFAVRHCCAALGSWEAAQQRRTPRLSSDLIEDAAQLVKVHRLDQMEIEAGFLAPTNIGFAAKSR